MNKGNLKVLAILFVFFLSACSNVGYLERKYLGRQCDPKLLKEINDLGHHRWKLRNFDVYYDYSINHNANTITFEGKFTYNVPVEKREYISEQVLLEYEYFELILVFAGHSGKIIAIDSVEIEPGRFLVDPFEFKAEAPYKNNYDSILFSYAFRSWSN